MGTLVAILAGGPGSTQPAEQGSAGSGSGLDSARVAALHGLAGEVLPAAPSARTAIREDVRAGFEALERLGAEIAAAEALPPGAPLGALGALVDQHRDAERAVTKLLARLRAENASERADQLAQLFAPLWSELGEAVTASGGLRAEKLAAARARLQEARSQRTDVHGPTVVVTPIGAER